MISFVREIQRAVEQSQVSDVRERQKLISLLLANHIAYNLSIPTSPLSSSKLFFGQNYGEWVKEVISDFNEHLVINTKMTYEVVEGIWTMRYRLVHEPRHSEVVDFFTRMMMSSSRPEIPENYSNVLYELNNESVERLNYYIGKSFNERADND